VLVQVLVKVKHKHKHYWFLYKILTIWWQILETETNYTTHDAYCILQKNENTPANPATNIFHFLSNCNNELNNFFSTTNSITVQCAVIEWKCPARLQLQGV
jgi:hypothetical protein